jgi:hypothetical protein
MRRLLQRQIKLAMLWATTTATIAVVATIEAVELGWYIVAVAAIATAAGATLSLYLGWRTLHTSRELPP